MILPHNEYFPQPYFLSKRIRFFFILRGFLCNQKKWSSHMYMREHTISTKNILKPNSMPKAVAFFYFI